MSHTSGIHPVLLIEDDDDTRDTMQLLLELKGFRVLVASNGLEGLRVLEQQGPACVILLDWMMPVMNGREFLDVIQKRAEYANIPVIVVTAFSGQDGSIPSNHLKKPVTTETLLREVSARCAHA